MSKVGDTHADGWQKVDKSFAREIRSQGSQDLKVTQQIEKSTVASNDALKQPQAAETAQASKPLQTVKDLPQTMQSARAELNGQLASVQKDQAAQNFMDARSNAKMLGQLSTGAQATGKSETAIKDAVIFNPPKQGAELGKNASNLPQQPVVTQHAANSTFINRSGDPLSKLRDTELKQKTGRETRNDRTNDDGTKSTKADANRVALPDADAAIHTGAVKDARPTVVDSHFGVEDSDSEDGGKGEAKTKDSSTFSTGRSRAKTVSKGLGELITGLGSGAAGGESDGDASGDGSDKDRAVVSTVARNAVELPERSPALHIYNEYDEAKPGFDVVQSKGHLFISSVEKRIVEIAKLDHEIDGKLRDMFRTEPLAKRFVGEVSSDIGRAIRMGFLNSVYGGGIIG